MRSLFERFRERLSRNPRLTRFAAVLVLVFLIGLPIANLVPRGLDVDYDFGENHRNFKTFRVAYLPVGQDAARALVRHFPSGAPATYHHHVELAPGRYEIHARLEGPDEIEEVVYFVTVGRSSHVRVRVRQGLDLR